MNQNLLLEIERNRKLMGLSPKNNLFESINRILISEQSISKFAQFLKYSDELFKDVSTAKGTLERMNKLIPDKNIKLRYTPVEIENLAKKLVDSRIEISTAAKTNNLGTLSDDAYTALKNFKTRIEQGKNIKSIENDALFTSEVQTQLSNLFDNPNSRVNSAYNDAFSDLDSTLMDYKGSELTLSKSELEAEFISNFKKSMDDLYGHKVTDSLEDKSLLEWAKNKFISEVDDWASKNEIVFSNETPKTNILDIKKPSPLLRGRNWRFINNFFRKLSDNLNKRNPKDALDEKLALLQGFPVSQMSSNGKVTKAFNDLVRGIAYDMDQINKFDRTIVDEWNALIEKIKSDAKGNPELEGLVDKMKDVLIYDSTFGLTFKKQSLDEYLKYLEEKYGAETSTLDRVKKGKEDLKTLTDRLKDFQKIFTGGLDSIIDKIGDFLRGISWKNFLSYPLFGMFRTPKQLGLMLGKRGFTVKGLLASFFETYFTLLFYKNVFLFVYLAVESLIQVIGERIGYDTIDAKGKKMGIVELAGKKYEMELTNFKNAYSWLPFDPKRSLVGKFITFMYKGVVSILTDDDIDKFEKELKISADEKFNLFWENLKTPEKEAAIAALTTPTGITTPFDRFSLRTGYTREANGVQLTGNSEYYLKNHPGLTIDNIVTLNNARVAEGELKSEVFTKDKIKTAASDKTGKAIKDLIKQVDFRSGAIRTKDGKLYEIEYSVNTDDFTFKPVSFLPVYDVYEETNQAGENDGYAIYYADSREDLPERIPTSEINSVNPVNMNEDGTFNKRSDAEIAAKELQKTVKLKISPNSIDVYELLKKL
jgi:hypothetical protein